MSVILANRLWCAVSRPSWNRFRHALSRPQQVQEALLMQTLRDNAATVFGQTHGFARLRSAREFQDHVPIRCYDEFEPYIQRVGAGETSVLTRDAVAMLEPSSGSAAASKLIPYTRTLQAQFMAGIAPWIVDLHRDRPDLANGPSYWSISPVAQSLQRTAGGIPIGFEEDTQYLGALQKRLVDKTMAVPASVRHLHDVDAFRMETLKHLVRARDLRMMSVWHPSFLMLLLDTLEERWDELRPSISATRPHAADLWPHLRLVSCWADGAAERHIEALQARLPGVEIQPKGLIATEAFVSLPFGRQQVLAVRSHFFEFQDERGAVHLAHELAEGAAYDVVVTTGGGLYRYALQDRVQVTGWCESTPTLRFLGKVDKISDLCGEKLHEAFVDGVLRGTLRSQGVRSSFAMLAPDGERAYTLYLESDQPVTSAALDAALQENFHYRYALQLGQLAPVRIFRIERGAQAAYETVCRTRGQRLGNIKPVALSPQSGWSEVFVGQYQP